MLKAELMKESEVQMIKTSDFMQIQQFLHSVTRMLSR